MMRPPPGSTLTDTPVPDSTLVRSLCSSARKRTIASGVDRLDYSKGLPERIDALERLFSSHEDMVNQLLFVQIAPPSREDVRSYQQIRATLEQKTGQFNGAHSDVDQIGRASCRARVCQYV